jgi:hypothetical protein
LSCLFLPCDEDYSKSPPLAPKCRQYSHRHLSFSLPSCQNPCLARSSFWQPSYGSFDSTLDINSNTYLWFYHQYFNGCSGCLDPFTNVQWLPSSCLFLPTSSSPTWNHFGVFMFRTTWLSFVMEHVLHVLCVCTGLINDPWFK